MITVLIYIYIRLYVDGMPIREFKNMESMGIPYPKDQPMRIYSSLWNADDWATQGGRVKTDWSLAPFTASYRNFRSAGCIWSYRTKETSCDSGDIKNYSWLTEELDSKSRAKMKSLQQKHMIYNYCEDNARFPQGLAPECNINVPTTSSGGTRKGRRGRRRGRSRKSGGNNKG